MPSTLVATQVSFQDLDRWGLQLSSDPDFFAECEADLTLLSAEDQARLDRVKTNFSHLLRHPPVLEDAVKLTVLAHLLDLADFYTEPVDLRTERSIEVEIETEDPQDNVLVRGTIDVLVLANNFWIVVIESKPAELSLDVGRPQVLSYMLGSPNGNRPCYGLLTNGSNFRFLKLQKTPQPIYGMSRIFDLYSPGQELYSVLAILKRLKTLALR